MDHATPASSPTRRQPEMHPERWGDPAAATTLPPATRDLVDLVLGAHDTPARPAAHLPVPSLPDAVLRALHDAVGAEHVLLDDDTRRRRTRGKSTPDLLRARAGDLGDAPDVVVRPADHDEVAAVLAVAVEHHVAVVPFGGGTSVTGGLVARREGHVGVVSLDLGRLRRLLGVDAVSMTATLEPGLRGPEAEALLTEHGLTLGHLPQSFEFATIGGFAATRSSGQASAGYGRFDALVVALRVATPRGDWRLGTAPASAAGPDLRQLVLGSEGAFGVITEVTVRVRPRPPVTGFEAWRFGSFAAGVTALRTLAQARTLPAVVRLSDETETALDLAHPDRIGADGGSDSGSDGGSGCLVVVGLEGTDAAVQRQRVALAADLTELGGVPLGTEPGLDWARGRFAAPYLRDALLDVGVLVETLETATAWSRVADLHAAVSAALTGSLGEPAIVLCHVSHVYETGCSLYFTVAAPQGDDPLGRWSAAKAAASAVIVAAGATITHHHAVGSDHRPWLAAEIGELGVSVLRAVKADLDPTGVLNPGILLP